MRTATGCPPAPLGSRSDTTRYSPPPAAAAGGYAPVGPSVEADADDEACVRVASIGDMPRSVSSLCGVCEP